MKQIVCILVALLSISLVSSAITPTIAPLPLLTTTSAPLAPLISAPTTTSTSAPLTLTPTNCKVAKTTQADTFSCPCSGGSGTYNWAFTELPSGWAIVNNSILSAPSGGIKDNLLYGCKVQVNDKTTKQSVSKSLFFYLKAGKIVTIVDYPYDFKSNMLISTAGSFLGAGLSILANIATILNPTSTSSAGVLNTNINTVKNLFGMVGGIGGGCGLATLRPYFLGNGGLYSNDSSNPYLNQLPTTAQVTNILSTGNSSSITTFLVYVVRSKVDCKSVATFLNNFLQQVRSKITDLGNQVNTSGSLILTIQGQIAALQTQLTAAQSTTSTISTATLTAQITTLQSSITQNQNTQTTLQTKITQLASNISSYQIQVANLVNQLKQFQQNDLDFTSQIDTYNQQIADLQAQIQNLTSLVNTISASKTQNTANITAIQNQINNLNNQINTANAQIVQTNAQIDTAKNAITSAQGQIALIQVTLSGLNSANANKPTVQSIQAQITQLQQNLTATNATLIKAQAAYDDLNSNYNSFT
jgi:peptidoglycan hydrolase CwlO-like protein